MNRGARKGYRQQRRPGRPRKLLAVRRPPPSVRSPRGRKSPTPAERKVKRIHPGCRSRSRPQPPNCPWLSSKPYEQAQSSR
ncbi:hypothetical protein AKJ65_07745 [candidate division MSBL1 archaeon SCGC-AAA259E19]|uniref:Uncharacterized protein n=1 Tax=candidate division MSBL1 archaeon SCGC-AAA259E19 TaxID=1698264 RepID=A0A133UDZ8_9EURY|nr:hypothetical protein AKJ65_07745 [candidate division MSBL1 archaeon SCGC-AAA259E19]